MQLSGNKLIVLDDNITMENRNLSEVMDKSKDASLINEFKDVLPIVTSFIIAVGIYRLTSYYSQFGIDITPYLEISEVLLLLFKYLTRYLFYFITLSGFIWIVQSVIPNKKNVPNKELVIATIVAFIIATVVPALAAFINYIKNVIDMNLFQEVIMLILTLLIISL